MTSPIGSTGNSDLFAAPLAGMRRGMERMNSAAEGIAHGDVSPENMVGLIEASQMVKASAAVAHTVDDVTKTLLDTFA